MRITVRKAKIDPKVRDQLELFGKDVVAIALGMTRLSTPDFGQPTHAQQIIFANQMPAMEWLREKRDEDERRETVTLWLEIAIVILIIVEIGLSSLSLYRDFHH